MSWQVSSTMQSIKARLNAIREQLLFKCIMLGLCLILTIVFAVAFATNPDVIDTLFIAAFVILTISYSVEIASLKDGTAKPVSKAKTMKAKAK
jgi:hypothetical protein